MGLAAPIAEVGRGDLARTLTTPAPGAFRASVHPTPLFWPIHPRGFRSTFYAGAACPGCNYCAWVAGLFCWVCRLT